MIGKGGVAAGVLVVGAIVADVGLILFGQGATTIPWSEDVKNLGFPVLVAIACGLALRALGREFLKSHNRYIDSRIADDKKVGRRLATLAKRMTALVKLQERQNEYMEMQGQKLTKISAQLSEQTGVIKEKGT